MVAHLDSFSSLFEGETHPEEGRKVRNGKQEAMLVAMARRELELESLEIEKVEV